MKRTTPLPSPAAYPATCSAVERAPHGHGGGVLQALRGPGLAEVSATWLDESIYLGSVRTIYRLLAALEEVCERRDPLRQPPYTRSGLLATGPNQVWSCNITKLLGPAKWTYVYLYVILDICSCYVGGWMVAHCAQAALAERWIRETHGKQTFAPGSLTIHPDRGALMTSTLVTWLLVDLGITKTHSRPHVSKDNPFSESRFRTLRYCLEFLDRFGSIEHAQAFCRHFFMWDYTEHHHKALALSTTSSLPEDVWIKPLIARHANRSDTKWSVELPQNH